MTDFKNIIEKLYNQDIKSDHARKSIEFLYKKRMEKHIPYWYQKQIRLLCILYNLDYHKEIYVPHDHDGMVITYAAPNTKLDLLIESITGARVTSKSMYRNVFWVEDSKFISSSAIDYKNRCRSDPGHIILLEDTLIFLPGRKIESRKLPIDTDIQ